MSVPGGQTYHPKRRRQESRQKPHPAADRRLGGQWHIKGWCGGFEGEEGDLKCWSWYGKALPLYVKPMRSMRYMVPFTSTPAGVRKPDARVIPYRGSRRLIFFRRR